MSKPKLKTENRVPNRKIKLMAYAGIATTVAFFVLNRLFHFDIPEDAVGEVITACIIAVTTIMSLAGYITRPAKGDGVVNDPD